MLSCELKKFVFNNSRFSGEDLPYKIYLSPSLATSAVRSKAVFLVVFIHCLLLLPLCVEGLCWAL